MPTVPATRAGNSGWRRLKGWAEMRPKTGLKVGVALIALASAGYGTVAAMTWLKFGRKRRTGKSSLDPFVPQPQVIERYCVTVDASAEKSFAAALQLRLEDSAAVRAIFKLREWFLGSKPTGANARLGLAEQAKLWGWGVLGESPGEEIVFGAVTQPWEARPKFEVVEPEKFAAFDRPGYVKIVWSLRVDPVDVSRSVLSTETRATTTDEISRARFRRYWAMVMPGTVVIRRVALYHAKRVAEVMMRTAANDKAKKQKEKAAVL